LILVQNPKKVEEMDLVATLALGPQPRQGLARLRAKRGSPRVKESVRE